MNEISVTVIDGVRIEDDGEVMHFTPVDKAPLSPIADTRSFWRKLTDWLKRSNVLPYVKIRDLSRPVDVPSSTEGGSKRGIEAGIKVSF